MKVASVFAISAVAEAGAKPLDPNLLCAHGHDDWKPRLSDKSPRRECSAGCSPKICDAKMKEHPKLSINKCYTPSQLNPDGSLRDHEDPRGCNFGSDDNTCAFEDGTNRCVYADLDLDPLKPEKYLISYAPPRKPQGLAAVSEATGGPGCHNPHEYRLVFRDDRKLVLLAMTDEEQPKPCNTAYRHYTDDDMAWSSSDGGMFSADTDSGAKGSKVCLKLDEDMNLVANSLPTGECTSDNAGSPEEDLWNFKVLDLDDDTLCMMDVTKDCLDNGHKGVEKCLTATGVKKTGDCSHHWKWESLKTKFSAQQELQTSSSSRAKCDGPDGCLKSIGSFSCATDAGCLLSPTEAACKDDGGDWCAAGVKPLDPNLLCAHGLDDWRQRRSDESPRRECSAGCSPKICDAKMKEHPKLSINKCYTQSQINPDGSLRDHEDPRGCNFGSDENTCAFEDGTNQCVYADLGSMMTV